MQKSNKDARKRPKSQPNLNLSSKTKKTLNDRKKKKKSLSLNTVLLKVNELGAADDLLLMKIFDNAKIESILDEILGESSVKQRDRIYTPQITLSLFVQQVLSPNLDVDR